MMLVGRQLRSDIEEVAEATGMEVVVRERARLGRAFQDDLGDMPEELAKGHVVILLATGVVHRHGGPFSPIKLVMDEQGRVGWLWQEESAPHDGWDDMSEDEREIAI